MARAIMTIRIMGLARGRIKPASGADTGGGVIPMRFLTSDSQVWKVGHRPNHVRITFELSQPTTKCFLYFIERFECLVRHGFFSQIFPDMLDRIEFRAMWRLREQSYV